MKRINVKDIILGKIYFSVTCGDISEIKFIEIDIPKARIEHADLIFETEIYLSDIGIEYENESYINNLNYVFETIEEAEKIISDELYKERLKNHFDECNIFDEC